MLDAGFETSKSDDCLFLLKGEDGRVNGMAGWHVDDGLLTGNEIFWQAMEKVAKNLEFGKRAEKSFRFCGMNVKQSEDGTVTLDQKDAVQNLVEIPVDKKRPRTDACTQQEVTALKGRIGAILYVTGMTRPYEAYEVSHIAAWANPQNARVEHLVMCNALIKSMRDEHPDLGLVYKGQCSLEYMYTFHDSSFKQERESGSQMGIFTFVGPQITTHGEIKGASLVRWASKRARRVCHSTMAAETLAATGGLDSQAGIKYRINELGYYPKSIMLTDCRSLFDHVYSMTGKTAEILLPDIHEMRESCMPWRSAFSEEWADDFVELWWVSTHKMLADHLTKTTAPSRFELINVLEKGLINLGKFDTDYKRPRVTQRAHVFWINSIFSVLHESAA